MDSIAETIRQALADIVPLGGYNPATDCESSTESSAKNSAENKFSSKESDETEVSLREEILQKLSQNLISREEANVSWVKSFARDLKRIREDLDTAEIALRGRRSDSKRKRHGNI